MRFPKLTKLLSLLCGLGAVVLMGSSLKLQLERNNAERLLYASDTCGAWDYTFLEQVIVNILVDVLWVFQSADTKRVLKEMSPDSLIMFFGLPKYIYNERLRYHFEVRTEDAGLGWKNLGDGFDGPWEKDADVNTYLVIDDDEIGLSMTAYNNDDIFSNEPDWFLNLRRLAMSDNPFGLLDTITYFDDSDHALNTASDIGIYLPISYNTGFDMVSDESFSRIFFYGMGVTLLQQETATPDPDYGPHVLDMPIQDFPMRDGFRPFGARVHFDENQQATAIYDYYKETLSLPGDDTWEEAKWVAKSTTFVFATAREHLLWTHFLMAQQVNYYYKKLLPPNHPIRRLLNVHFYRTSRVNSLAFTALLPENNLLHRFSGLTFEGVEQLLEYCVATSHIYEPFKDWYVNPSLNESVANGTFPFYSQGVVFYEIVEEFVTNWIAEGGDTSVDEDGVAFYDALRETTLNQNYTLPEYEDSQSMVDLLSQIIFTVTAWHEVVGYVRDLYKPTGGSGVRMSEDCDTTQTDAQTYLYGILTVITTSLEMPMLIDDFPYYFGSGGAPDWERTAWDDFREAIFNQSTVVKAEDEARIAAGYPEFKHMDPVRFESAVSV